MTALWQGTDNALLRLMIANMLSHIRDVVERQYQTYFDLTREEEEKAKSASSGARLHNINAEAMGMLSTAKIRTMLPRISYRLG